MKKERDATAVSLCRGCCHGMYIKAYRHPNSVDTDEVTLFTCLVLPREDYAQLEKYSVKDSFGAVHITECTQEMKRVETPGRRFTKKIYPGEIRQGSLYYCEETDKTSIFVDGAWKVCCSGRAHFARSKSDE